jgi:hypothetical protein
MSAEGSDSEPRDPVPAVVELDGWTIRLLEPSHSELVVQLLAQRGNRYVLDMPNADAATVTALIGELSRSPWTLPLAATRDGELFGVGTTALADVKSLHASFTSLFVDPPAARTPLAMIVRHLFWSFPINRLHVQIPAMDLTREYVELYTSVGFVDEGRLVAHALVGGQPFDIAVLGLLRRDFEAWTDAEEPRLGLRSRTS